jgi:outer membrane protein OmpA-like peptidoglycan-associated protein
MSANASVKNISDRVCCVFLLTIVLISGSMANVLAEDCPRAKELYARGIKLLNYEERKAIFQKSVELCPSFAEAYVNLADALENLGLIKKSANEENTRESNALLDSAEKYYSKALDLNDKLIPAHFGLADILMGQGRYGIAAEHYSKILALCRYHEDAEKGLSRAKEELCKETKRTGIRTSEQIRNEAVTNNLCDREKTMGIEDYVVKDRQSFSNILFEGWSAIVRPGEPTEQLKEIGKALSSEDFACFKFIVEGHANIVGGYDDNIDLSRRRSAAVKDFLVKKFHISADRILTQGFGYTRPIFTQGNDPRNRRVEVVFFNEEKAR